MMVIRDSLWLEISFFVSIYKCITLVFSCLRLQVHSFIEKNMQILFICFLIIPIVEMWVLIEVGSFIGTLFTVGLVLLTAVIGVSLLKKQGLSTFIKANQRMQAGQMPVTEMGEGLMLAVAGALLVTPGFVTDSIGFMLLTPGIRKILAKSMLTKMMVSGQAQAYSAQAHYSNQGDGFKESNVRPAVLEGEYRDVTTSKAEKDSNDA